MKSSASRVVGIYQRAGASWVKARAAEAFIERGWVDRFRSLLSPPGDVLDLGCGSGAPIAEYLIERRHHVVGVDSAPAFIADAKSRFPETEWHLADMRSLALERTFDGILAWDSFFHLRPNEQRAMFARFERHAASRAVLMFKSGPAYGEANGELGGRATLPQQPRRLGISPAPSGSWLSSHRPRRRRSGVRQAHRLARAAPVASGAPVIVC